MQRSSPPIATRNVSNWLALLGWTLAFAGAGFLAADTIATIRHFGLTGMRPPLSVGQTSIRIAIVYAALGLLSAFRDAFERLTLITGAAAAGSSALYGFGLRADALSAFRLLSHLAVFVLALVVTARRIAGSMERIWLNRSKRSIGNFRNS